MNKYKCIKNFFINGVKYASVNDIVVIKDLDVYNITKHLDFKFESIPNRTIDEHFILLNRKTPIYGDQDSVFEEELENEEINKSPKTILDDLTKKLDKLGVTWIEDNSFESVIKEMIDTYKRKNSDYGNSFDKSLDKFGLIASVVRLSDKFNRINQLIQNKEQQVKDESIRDTFMDMANYCAMTVAWMDQQN